jgi:cytosine/adenosine deaminase-related metal-dependent hydrolase
MNNSRMELEHDGACFFGGKVANAPVLSVSRRQVLSYAAAAGVALTGSSGHAEEQKRRTREKLPHRDCIIEASWVLAYLEGRLVLIPDGSVRVRDDKIVEVKAGRIAGRDRRVPANGQVLLPGFISGHTHACSATPTRGIIEGGRSYARPLELVETLNDEDLDALTAHNVAELLRSGTTTHVEMSLSLRQAESYVRIAKRWGVRGYPGGMIPGIGRLFPIWFSDGDQVLPDSVPETLKEIEANRTFALKYNGAEDGRILPQMAPHATDTHTPETLKAILAAAKELGNGIHLHLSQSAKETATVQRVWGKRPVEWLDELGFFSQRVIGAHLSGVDLKNDLPILANRSFLYAHCPSGGGAGGTSGSQPYPEALAAGVRTTIGIDTHSNDYVENVKLAVLYGKARARLLANVSAVPLTSPTVWQAIEGATLHAAQGLGREDLGRIAPGAKADLCTIDVTNFLTGVGVIPPEPLNNLLYANGLSVRHVMTDGYFQVFDGRFVVDDEERVKQRGGAVVEKIWAQLRAEKWFA